MRTLMFCWMHYLKMAASSTAGKLPADSREFDAEFEKFMNEPLSDDSHRTASPMYHQIRGSLEPHSTQDSFERALADELSTTVTASDSLPATKQKDNINQYREEEIDDKDTEKELPIATAVSKTSRINQQKESYMTETANSTATIRAPRDDTMQDSRFFPGHSFDGMDTLEELADKEQFFNNLAADVSGTLDFGKLNRALDEIQSDNEKSDDLVTVLGIKNAPEEEGGRLSEVVEPDKDAELEDGAQGAASNMLSLDHHLDKNMLYRNLDEEFNHGMVHTSSDKDIPVNASRELQQSSVADYDSDTPPSDSLRTIKEVAKARLKEAKEKNKDKVGTSSSDRIPGSNERKSSLSRLPRPLGESRRKWSDTKEVRRRRSSSHRSASSYSTCKDSASTDSSVKSSKHDFKPHESIDPSPETRFQFSEDFITSRASHGGERTPKSNLVFSNERVIPAQKTKDISRELQLQSELYELRSDYNKVLRDNEKLGRELEKVSKSRNENEMRLKYEFELEQLIQKNSALEKQLKKAKELRIRRESDDDDEPEKKVSAETLQLRKELQEQELLLNGYQLENERLFKEMKRKDSERKQLQSTLVEENQRLRNSLAESEKRREYLDIQLQELRKEKEKCNFLKTSKGDDHEIKDSMKRLLAENDSLQQEVISLKEDVDTNEKVIKDLERQNREMETIVKKRYPDAIPSLLTGQDAVHKLDIKSAVSPLKEDKNVQVTIDKDPPYNSKHVEYLERTIRRLEKELDSKDEETTRLLSASQLRYKEMSSIYEGHIDGLQKKLDATMAKQKLFEEAKTAVFSEFGKRNVAKNDEMDEAILAEEAGPRNRRRRGRGVREEKEKVRRIGVDDDIELRRAVAERASSPIFPAPDDFDLSGLQRENIDLTLKLDRLRADYEELRVKHAAELAKSDAECGRVRSNAIAEIEEVRKIQIREAEVAKESQMKFEQALSKLQDENDHLMKRVSEYDFISEKLKEKKLEATVDRELLQAAKLKEEVLHNQVKLLQKQLKDAIECQPLPQQRMNHIEMQIAAIQQRQVDREDELQKVMRTTHSKYYSGVNQYGVDWSKIVEAKDKQIKQFREELDEILHTLHSLYASNSVFYKENGNFVPYGNAR